MSTYSLPKLLESLHESVEQGLRRIRSTLHHPGVKGDASESVWIDLLNEYLPQRYRAARAHVVDSDGGVSQQIDVVIFDRQYSPFIFKLQEHSFIPAESVYAVFEAKQEANASIIEYAQQKVGSVRSLSRKCLPIPGESFAREPVRILGGVLTLESGWKPPMGRPLERALASNVETGRIDIGCIASHGTFFYNDASAKYSFEEAPRAATAFLFRLIARLQALGTVPMIDLEPYARWLGRSVTVASTDGKKATSGMPAKKRAGGTGKRAKSKGKSGSARGH